ncbi:MAG: DUF1189 domain-containing protein [bacterium]
MDTEPKGFFASIPQSCTDFQFYKEVAVQPMKKALLYIFLILLIAAVLMSIGNIIRVNKVIDIVKNWEIKNVPEIRIVDGKTQVDVPQPFTVWKDENFIFLIDTTGQYTSIDTIYKAGALLTQTKLIMKQDELRTQQYELSQFPNVTVNKDSITRWSKIGQTIIWIILPIGTYFYLLFAKWFQIILFSLFTLSLNNSMKTNLKYPQLLKIGIYALTAPIILDIIYSLVGRPNSLIILIYIAVYVIYLTMAMKQFKPQDNGSQLPY